MSHRLTGKAATKAITSETPRLQLLVFVGVGHYTRRGMSGYLDEA
jgi:hypothetical protein